MAWFIGVILVGSQFQLPSNTETAPPPQPLPHRLLAVSPLSRGIGATEIELSAEQCDRIADMNEE